MSEWQNKAKIEKINVWISTVALGLASAWGVTAFFIDKYIIPKSAPVNISISLDVTSKNRVKLYDANFYRPVSLEASVTNPSTRTVSILYSRVFVWGNKYKPALSGSFDDDLESGSLIKQHNDTYHTRHNNNFDSTVVAVGGFLPDDTLKPQETVKRTILLYLPEGKYDSIAVSVDLLSASSLINDLEFSSPYDKDSDSFALKVFVSKNGKNVKDVSDEFLTIYKSHELQQAKWSGLFSL